MEDAALFKEMGEPRRNRTIGFGADISVQVQFDSFYVNANIFSPCSVLE